MQKKGQELINSLLLISQKFEFINSSKDSRILKLDDELVQIGQALNSQKYKINLEAVPKDRVIEINKKFFKDNLPLHEVLIKEKDVMKYASPFQIPIVYRGKEDYEINYEFFDKNSNYGDRAFFKSIVMPKRNTQCSISYYAHELIHSQIDRKKGIQKNFFNKEVLSIFIEKVITEETIPTCLDTIRLDRMKMLKVAFNHYYDKVFINKEEDYNEYMAESYIISTLIANHLFDIYHHSTVMQKKEILKMCHNIFTELITVEDFMDIMCVNYENSKKLEYIK